MNNEVEPICPICKKNKAFRHDVYGYLPCVPCREKQSGIRSPKQTVEMTTPEIKDARVQYKDEIVQPFREGKVSREYIEKYGSKGIKATKQEIKKAEYVWNDTEYYKK